MTPSTSRSNTFILLFYLLFPFILASCPKKCANGYNAQDCKCESNCYRQRRQGIQTCQRCTEICSEDKNQVEVTPCTQEHNRVCFCKPGFYCEERYEYETYCHRCVPCETGTFSSKASLDRMCTRHTDCARLGMTIVKPGDTTKDTECASLYTPSSIINTINTTSNLKRAIAPLVEESTTTQDGENVYSTTKMAASSTPSSNIYTNTASTLRRVTRGAKTAKPDGENVYTTTKMESSSIPSSTINAIDTNTASTVKRGESTTTQDGENVYSTTKMAASSIHSSTINTIDTNAASNLREGTAQPMDQEKEFHWQLLLILLLMLLFMAGFCMLMKSKTLKTLSKCFGLIKGEHEEQQHSRWIAGDHQILSNSYSSTDMETKIPPGDNVREVKSPNMEMAPQSGVVRQVTVEHNGRGENVNNTVGSIYIYSPGTVILGSNSGDKKEEAGVCEEARPLIGSPQQESNPPSQEVRIRMSAQEEAKEELSLSFPVPATGK